MNYSNPLRRFWKRLHPEIISDVMQSGVYLAGGGALIRGLPELLARNLGLPVVVASDPLTAVVRGTSVVLNEIELFRESILSNEDELVPTE